MKVYQVHQAAHMDAGMDDCREDPRASTLAYMKEHKLQELVEVR